MSRTKRVPIMTDFKCELWKGGGEGGERALERIKLADEVLLGFLHWVNRSNSPEI